GDNDFAFAAIWSEELPACQHARLAQMFHRWIER
ncbi:unnamed protein product, partial [marine sediment metagenome]